MRLNRPPMPGTNAHIPFLFPFYFVSHSVGVRLCTEEGEKGGLAGNTRIAKGRGR